MYHDLFDASLRFTNVEVGDNGTYQCTVANEEGQSISNEVVLTVQGMELLKLCSNMSNNVESTCFDNVLSSHETDVDCGGVYCHECNHTQVYKLNVVDIYFVYYRNVS